MASREFETPPGDAAPASAQAARAAAGVSAAAPIGIFDSGVGGMSILDAIHQLLPHESLLYCADSLYAPYGERDDDYIIDRSLAVCDWLLEQPVKALVVACNTATAQTIEQLRRHTAHLDLPIVGIEPGVKPAALLSKRRIAGVLATASTLKSQRFQALLARHAGDCHFVCVAGNGLVEAIERGDTSSPELITRLERYLDEILDAGADTLVLGCTHYPFLEAAIRKIAGDYLTLIDTAAPVARQLERLLLQQNLAAPERSGLPEIRLNSTGDTGPLYTLAAKLGIAAEIHAQPLHIVSARTVDTCCRRP
jgi:glutamate racemase